MKYLPEIFPIRYAIIVSSWLEEDWLNKDELQFYIPPKREMLFRQLLLDLQKNGLSTELLHPSEQSIKFTFMGVESMNMAKLNPPIDWLNNLEKKVLEIIPEAKCSSRSRGKPFDLGIYCYKNASEIPSFLAAYNLIEKYGGHTMQAISKIIDKFGYIENHRDIKYLHSIFQKIKDDKIDSFQLYESLARFSKPIYISIPDSNIWEKLDKVYREGAIGVGKGFHHDKEDLIADLDLNEEDDRPSRNKISVVVCKSWEELFAEEISVIYKMFNFCKNCGKALPFDYQGKYCPETKENKECVKGRARDRARKITNSKKKL